MTVQPPGNFDFDASANAAVAQSVSLVNDTGSIAGGSEYQSAVVAINTVGYEVFLNLEFATTPTVPQVDVVIQWNDTASTDSIYSEEIWLAIPATSLTFPTKVGPAKGNQLQIRILNQDASAAVNYQVVVNGSSRSYPDLPWQYDLGTAPATYTNVNMRTEMGLLGSASPSVTVATPVARLLPAYYGIAEFAFAPPATGTGILSLTPIANVGFTIQPLAPIVAAVAGQAVWAARALPACPVLATITNTGSATGTFTLSVIAQRISR